MNTPILGLAVLLSLVAPPAGEGEEAAATGKEPRSVLSWATPIASPDGRTIAIGCSDGTLRLVDVETRRQVRSIAEHEKPIRWIAWSTDGALLAVADGDGLVVTVDAGTGERVSSYQVSAGGWEMSLRRRRLFEFQPEGPLLLTRLDPGKPTTVWNVREGVEVPISDVPGFEVEHADWSRDGGLLVCRGPKGVLVLDRELSEAGVSTALAARIGSFAPDGKRIVTSAGGLDVTLVDAERLVSTSTRKAPGELLGIFDDFLSSARFSRSGARVVTTTSEWATVTCWDAVTGESLWTVELNGGNPQLNDAEFVLGDRRVLVSGFTNRILDAETGRTLAGPLRAGARPVAASSEGRFVVAVTRHVVEVWDGETLEPTFAFVPLADGAWRVDEPDR